MGHRFWLRCTTAVFVYPTHSTVVSQFVNAILRPTGRMMAGTRATPPYVGGHAVPKSGTLGHTSFRPHDGSLSSSFIPAGRLGTAPLSPRALLCRIGPRRQGFASPLRALDGSGTILKTRCLRGERGGVGPWGAERGVFPNSRRPEGYYASNNTDRPGRARPTPRHGGAAGRRHADHP